MGRTIDLVRLTPEAPDLRIHILAAFDEHEAKRIGERTKEALRAA